MANEVETIIARAIKDAVNTAEDYPPPHVWIADKVVAKLDAAGFVIVPKEPTEEMGAAGARADFTANHFGNRQAVNPNDARWLSEEDCGRLNLWGDAVAANPSRWQMPVYRAMIEARPK